MQLQFSCSHCGTKGLTPDLDMGASLGLAFGLRRLRCPSCGDILAGASQIAPEVRIQEEIVIPAGFHLFVRGASASGVAGLPSACVLGESAAADILGAELETYGFDIVRISSSADALATLRRQMPDLIALDLSLWKSAQLIHAVETDPVLCAAYSQLPLAHESEGSSGPGPGSLAT